MKGVPGRKGGMIVIELYQGDCIKHMYSIENESIDLILQDPPFLPTKIQKTAYKQIRDDNQNNLKSIFTPLKYKKWWDNLVGISMMLLKPSGYFIYKSDPYTAREVYPITKSCFHFTKSVIWDKGKIGLGRKIRMQHEILEVYQTFDKCAHYWKYPTIMNSKKDLFTNLDGKKIEVKSQQKWHGSGKGIAFPSILKFLPLGNGLLGSDNQTHINQTPAGLWEKFIDYMCPPDGTVLDPCMGSGSVGMAVTKLNKRKGVNRKYIGIEIDPEFFIIAKNNLPEAQTP
jgi:site-specific DNA-methyltransferase (adenine-specific)